MHTIFDYMLQARTNFKNLINGLSVEELNAIPPGFGNNIAWNYGHISVATPGLCYLRSKVNTDMHIPRLSKYAPGTRPEANIPIEEIDEIAAYSLASIEQIRKDYEQGIFAKVEPYATQTFVLPMESIEEILHCVFAHDNYHLAYSRALKKAIGK